jgi:hypothetical protein
MKLEIVHMYWVGARLFFRCSQLLVPVTVVYAQLSGEAGHEQAKPDQPQEPLTHTVGMNDQHGRQVLQEALPLLTLSISNIIHSHSRSRSRSHSHSYSQINTEPSEREQRVAIGGTKRAQLSGNSSRARVGRHSSDRTNSSSCSSGIKSAGEGLTLRTKSGEHPLLRSENPGSENPEG